MPLFFLSCFLFPLYSASFFFSSLFNWSKLWLSSKNVLIFWGCMLGYGNMNIFSYICSPTLQQVSSFLSIVTSPKISCSSLHKFWYIQGQEIKAIHQTKTSYKIKIMLMNRGRQFRNYHYGTKVKTESCRFRTLTQRFMKNALQRKKKNFDYTIFFQLENAKIS